MRAAKNTSTRSQCLVIGTGHNGLGVAARLKSQGVEAIVLDQNATIGDQWRNRYERLHLHHITDAMHFPGVRYPKHVPRYLSRLDIADYQEAYAKLNDLDVRLNHRVVRLSPNASGEWEAEVECPGESGTVLFRASEVVLAAGIGGVTPQVPEIEGREQWGGQVLHSKDYHNADGFKGKKVLVVGCGNSGVELCCDLYDNGAEPSLLVRGPNTWITREAFALYHSSMPFFGFILKYIPFTWLLVPLLNFALDRYFHFEIRRRYGDLSDKGILFHSTPPLWRMLTTGFAKAPTYVDGTWGDVGVSILDLIREDKVPTFTSEISHFEPGGKTVVFKDGKRAEFDAVLLCTGFQPIVTHYATFVDKAVMEKMGREGVFRIWEEMEGIPGLWLSMGGIASTRYSGLVLADRIAAKVQGNPPPRRILSGLAAFAIGGIDPGLVQVPKRTIVINVVAGLALLGWLAGLI